MLPGRIYSYECQRRLLKAVVCSPFDEAIGMLADTTGLGVPKRSAEQLVRDAAVDFEQFYAQRAGADVKPAEGEIVAFSPLPRRTTRSARSGLTMGRASATSR